ncbi:chorismate mutase [Bartonella sp. B30(2025)]
MQEEILNKLAHLRSSIDNFDAALIHILAERFRCTKAIGHLKACHDLPMVDHLREQRQVTRLRQLAMESHLDPDFTERFLKFIIKEVVHHHGIIADEQKREQVNLNESQS